MKMNWSHRVFHGMNVESVEDEKVQVQVVAVVVVVVQFLEKLKE